MGHNVMTIDLTILVYFSVFILSLLGFILFAWWWRKNRSATFIYAYVTLLFFAEAYGKAIELYARFIKNSDPDLYFSILSGPLFSYRDFPQLIIYFLIIWHVSCRIRRTLKSSRQLKMTYEEIDKKFSSKILVVEDNEDVCSMLDISLKKYFPNGEVLCATRVQEALDILERNPEIDIVISDLKLPRRTGVQLCGLIKDSRPWISIIAITGYTEEYEFWHARSMGFDDYLMKPFRLGDLVASIQRESEKIKHWHKVRDRKGSDICNGNKHKRGGDINENTIVGAKHK